MQIFPDGCSSVGNIISKEDSAVSFADIIAALARASKQNNLPMALSLLKSALKHLLTC